MDIINMAKELGTAIASSKEMMRFKDAEAFIERDEQSKTLLNDLKLLQGEMMKAFDENGDIIGDIKNKIKSKQDELRSYQPTKEYFESKAAFEGFMKTVNDVIIFSITGEEPCSPNKCGSCGGCK